MGVSQKLSENDRYTDDKVKSVIATNLSIGEHKTEIYLRSVHECDFRRMFRKSLKAIVDRRERNHKFDSLRAKCILCAMRETLMDIRYRRN